MKCDRVRELIADYVDGDCGLRARVRIDRKVASCPCCADTLAEEKRLRGVLGCWKDEEPAEDVWHRIRSMAAPALTASVEPPASWRSVFAGLGRQAVPYMLGAATAVVVMVAVGFEPDESDSVKSTSTIAAPRPASTVVHDDSHYAATEVSHIDPRSGTIRSRRHLVPTVEGPRRVSLSGQRAVGVIELSGGGVGVRTSGGARTWTASKTRRTH